MKNLPRIAILIIAAALAAPLAAQDTSADANMRKTYADRVSKAVSPTAAARYLQIESKIRAIVRYELAANIPLVP